MTSARTSSCWPSAISARAKICPITSSSTSRPGARSCPTPPRPPSRGPRKPGWRSELVALEPGEAPDWAEAAAYIDALILEEIEDDLLEQCGVSPDHDPRETWLETVKSRLREDLRAFRADIEDNHDAIEEWDFRDGRIFASVGSFEDESDPDSGHGWLCRLLDVGALAAAGFQRVRKAQLLP